MSEKQGRRGPGRTALLTLLIALAVAIALADQGTKYLAEANLTPGVRVPVLGDVLGLQLIYNPGAAFSLATGMTWIFTVVAAVVVVVVLRASRKLGSLGWAMALGLLLGGCLGNLYDRLLRDPGFARGHVVDFINYNGWFVGNIADIAIVVAAVVIAVLAIRGVEIDGSRATPEVEPAQVEEEPADEDVDVATWLSGSRARVEPAEPAPAGEQAPAEPPETVPAPEAPETPARPTAGSHPARRAGPERDG